MTAIGPGLDEFLLPVWDYVASFGGELRLEDPADLPATVEVASMLLDMPCELTVESTDEGIGRILAAPPTQHLTTSIMPPFHRLRLRLEAR